MKKIRIKYRRKRLDGKEEDFYSTREVGEVIEEGRFCGLIDTVLDIEEVEPFPKEWHWNWGRWCTDNCDNIGQCGWNRENCPHTYFKLVLFKGENIEIQ